jgi:hypothetical protein
MTDSERLDRIEKDLREIRETLVMSLAVQQLIAVKNGIAPKDFQAMSPVPIPTPFDILDSLLKRDKELNTTD